MVNQRVCGLAVLALLFPLLSSVEAQQPGKIPHIGYLAGASLSSNPARLKAFRQSLRDLGYLEGQNIVIEWRAGEGKREKLEELATELVQQKMAVIVTMPPSTQVVHKARSTIPIVMAFDNDPIGNGLIASLAKPGGNITGLSTLAPELTGKQLELLKEIVPKLSRVAVLGNSNEPNNGKTLNEIEAAARVLGIQLQYLDARDLNGIATAFRDARKELLKR